MERIFEIVILSLITVPLGVLLGFSAVYVFNKMPAKWLCDYGEAPLPELSDENVKRLKEYPAKIYFSMLFVIFGIYLTTQNYVFGFPALFEMWLLLLISLSDRKYMIIPDQFVIFLALFSFPMSVFRDSVSDMVYGALLGFGTMMLVAVIGKLATRREALGFGDVKLMSAIGLTAGLRGTAFVLVMTSLISAGYFAIGIVRGKVKRGDEKPLGPFIATAMTIYLLISAAF